MSNHLAIATVTATLGQLVLTAAESAVAGVTLRFGRPTAPTEGERKVHVYLYQVTPNAARRNVDLPTRNSDGRLTGRPQAALDLHYLLSFYGDDSKLEPDRMLGAVARDLHARPQLTGQTLSDAIAARGELTGSDLATAIDAVKFTPTPLSLDDMSRLWSVMVQTPHALSVPYVGTVVLIDAVETPQAPLPVLKRGKDDKGVDTRIGPFPQLSAYWAGAPAVADRVPRLPSLPTAQLGAVMILEGANLGGDVVTARFAHPLLDKPLEIVVPPVDRDQNSVRLTLPDDGPAQTAWRSGIYSVSIVRDRGGATQSSNVLAIALAPRLTGVAPNPAARDGAGGVALTIACRPEVVPKQRATLLVADREIEADAHAASTAALTFHLENAPPGPAQLVRLRVDGVDSSPVIYDAPSGEFAFDDAQRVTIT